VRRRPAGYLYHQVGVANRQPSLQERHKSLIALLEVPEPDGGVDQYVHEVEASS